MKGTVNVKDGSGNMFSKKLADLRVGDAVESVDDNGNIVFTNVYFIAHDEGNQLGKLLRVHYEDNDGKTGHIGLSDRHLIYATKSDADYQTADKAKPIMASKLVKGIIKIVNSSIRKNLFSFKDFYTTFEAHTCFLLKIFLRE